MRAFARRFACLTACLVLSVTAARAAAQDEAEPVTIFAAASTGDAIGEIAEAYAATSGGSVRPVIAASSTLARQIAQGAPADLFLSASVQWMDFLEERHLVATDSRRPLLANRLVLIAPADSPLSLRLVPELPLSELLADGRLAIGDPAHVPAGIYARQALQALGLWDQVADRLAQAGNVRAALALVDRGEAAAGIVYETDAAISPRVRIVDAFPADATPDIVYPLAIVAGRDSPAVRAVYDFLTGDVAAAIFARHGFTRAHPAS